MSRRRSSSEIDPKEAVGEGGDIKPDRFPKEYEWMSGRSVYWRPESRASNVAKRDVIENEREQDEVSSAYVASTIARRALAPEKIDEEITAFQKWEHAERERGTEHQDPASD